MRAAANNCSTQVHIELLHLLLHPLFFGASLLLVHFLNLFYCAPFFWLFFFVCVFFFFSASSSSSSPFPAIVTPKGLPRWVSPEGVVPCGWKRSPVAVATYHPPAGPRSHKPSMSELQGNTEYRVQFQYLLFTNARRNLLIS